MFPAITKIGRGLLLSCAGATALLGCPLHSDECDSRSDCASGFYCDQFSRRCEPVLEVPGCARPDQCETGETCTPDAICRPGSCDFHGCVRGYVCGVVDSAHTCVLPSSGAPDLDAGVDGGSDAAGDAAIPADAGFELDAGLSDAADASQ